MVLGFEGEEEAWKVDTEEWGPLSMLGYASSISDEDLCARPGGIGNCCVQLDYFPGQLSVCKLAHDNPRHEWPGVRDEDGTVVACARHTIAVESSDG